MLRLDVTITVKDKTRQAKPNIEMRDLHDLKFVEEYLGALRDMDGSLKPGESYEINLTIRGTYGGKRK